MQNRIKIALNLLGYKGFCCLDEIVKSGFSNRFDFTVIYGTDSNLSNDYSKEIITLCNGNQIKVFHRAEGTTCNEFDYIVAIGWRWLIKDVQEKRLIIFHDSLLPKYRGFAPLVNAALNKEEKIGVTALFGAAQYDKGDIILQRALEVSYPIRVSELIKQISICYVELITAIMEELARGNVLKGYNQCEYEASYSVWLDSSDYYLDWSDSSSNLANKINLLGAPYQHALSLISEEKGEVVIKSAEEYSNYSIERRHVGKVLLIEDGYPVVICGEGLLKITEMSDKYGNNLIPFKRFRVRFK